MRRFSWTWCLAVWGSLVCCGQAANKVGKPPVGPAPVVSAIERLEAWLAGGPHVEGWRGYLQLDALRNGLARPGGADLAAAETTLRRLCQNQPGLELPPFLDLRTALEGWLARAALPDSARLKAVTDSLQQRLLAAQGTNQSHAPLRLVAEQRPTDEALRAQREFSNRLTILRVLLASYARDPSPWLADEIGATLDWLSGSGKAEPLVAAVRDYYGHPNVWIEVSERALASGVEGDIERITAVEDFILGTAVRGQGNTKATKTLIFAPHDERAVLRLRVSGTIDTTTLGRNGPARIHSRARTAFSAEKDFWLSERGLQALPTVCAAETTTLSANVSAVSPGVRGRIVKRVAQRQVQQKRAQADQIAARHAEDEIRELVDQEASELVSHIDRCAVAPLLTLAKGSAGAVQLRFCSGKGLLRIGVVFGPLGAPPDELNLPLLSGLALRWHSSVGERLMQYRAMKVVMASLQPSNPLTERLGAIVPTSLVKAVSPPQLVQASPAASAPSPGPSAAFTFTERLEDALQRCLREWFEPEITSRGIALRDGRWGTLAPGGPGFEWISVAWNSPGRHVEPQAPR